MRGLLCVQFLAALNTFLGGDPILSKNVMREIFDNLSWQALSKGYDKAKIQFSSIAVLVKNINYTLEKKNNENKLENKIIEEKIQIQLLKKIYQKPKLN